MPHFFLILDHGSEAFFLLANPLLESLYLILLGLQAFSPGKNFIAGCRGHLLPPD
jgi:hypothetical protein